MIPCDPDTYNQLPPEIMRKLEELNGQQLERFPRPAPKAFTWDDARGIAIFVRDGLLMIVKGLERMFDLGKK